MSESLDCNIHLIFPISLKSNLSDRDIETDNYKIYPLSIKSSHQRLMMFQGATSLINKIRPDHIIFDLDPCSATGLISLFWKFKYATKLHFISCENFHRNFLSEAIIALRKLKLKEMVEKLFLFIASKIVKQRVDTVFVLSNDGKEVSEKQEYAKKIVKFPLGYDPKIFFKFPQHEILETKKILGLTQKVFAYFGRISPEKGLDLLISALLTIQDRKWQLLVDDFQSSGAEYAQKIQFLISKLDDPSRVVSFQANHEEIAKYINCSDIVVVPTVQNDFAKEQYGRIIQEAMACKKLVIGSTSGAIPERIGEFGLLFKCNDVNDLANKLTEALELETSNYEELTTSAKKYAEKHFTIKKQAEIMATVILDK